MIKKIFIMCLFIMFLIVGNSCSKKEKVNIEYKYYKPDDAIYYASHFLLDTDEIKDEKFIFYFFADIEKIKIESISMYDSFGTEVNFEYKKNETYMEKKNETSSGIYYLYCFETYISHLSFKNRVIKELVLRYENKSMTFPVDLKFEVSSEPIFRNQTNNINQLSSTIEKVDRTSILTKYSFQLLDARNSYYLSKIEVSEFLQIDFENSFMRERSIEDITDDKKYEKIEFNKKINTTNLDLKVTMSLTNNVFLFNTILFVTLESSMKGKIKFPLPDYRMSNYSMSQLIEYIKEIDISDFHEAIER
ncbi:hypothetical protein [Haploplasma axanthum]|nr:hypothetical protein [Haploplasma axanthum]